MGPYCNFCKRRCFLHFPQDTPDHILKAYGTSTIIATCQSGQEFERQKVGFCYDDIIEEIKLRQPEATLNSKKYDNGTLWVACSDCNRGGNGTAEHKCCAGGHIKQWNTLGCWSGVLSPDQIEQLKGPILKSDGIQDDADLRWHQVNDAILPSPPS